jgi:hypothetical protein
MKLSGGKGYYIVLTAAALGLATAGSANAQTDLIINIDTAYSGSVSLGGTSLQNEDVYLTAFKATYNGGTPLPNGTSNPFNTFCIDITPDLANGNNGQYSGSWNAQNFPPSGPPPQNGVAQPPYVAGGIQEAANIYKTYVGNVDISTAPGQLWGAALQVAIWSDLYGTSPSTGFSVSGGNYSTTYNGISIPALGATSVSVQNLVNYILGSSANYANPNLNSTFWNAVNPVANQDLIGPQVETGFMIPESRSYGSLAGLTVLGITLGSQLRRKLARVTGSF